jgi:hypothetical protein
MLYSLSLEKQKFARILGSQPERRYGKGKNKQKQNGTARNQKKNRKLTRTRPSYLPAYPPAHQSSSRTRDGKYIIASFSLITMYPCRKLQASPHQTGFWRRRAMMNNKIMLNEVVYSKSVSNKQVDVFCCLIIIFFYFLLFFVRAMWKLGEATISER